MNRKIENVDALHVMNYDLQTGYIYTEIKSYLCGIRLKLNKEGQR